METFPQTIANPGAEKCHIAGTFGSFLYEALEKYPDFYFFSPDETTSNRMQQVYDSTNRAWTRKREAWDEHLSADGRILEMLSENTLFAVYSAHVLSGGRGAMTSYESFFQIIASQLDQYLKFLKQSKEVSWRKDYHGLILLSTSCWQRQDHNGYSHQNPALVSELLMKNSNLVNCFFPVDDVAAAAAWEYMDKSMNVVNLATFNKNPQPRWIDINHARFQLENGGASICGFASDDDPWVVVAGIGDLPTQEAIEGINLAKKMLPELKVRFVNIATLSYAAIGTVDNKLSQEKFDEYFTQDLPIVVNFHGYPEAFRSIISHYTDARRASIHGYEDEGSTTTPLDELGRNNCSRFDIAADILHKVNRNDLAEELMETKIKNREYAKIYDKDEQ